MYSYIDYINEISSEELFKGLIVCGLFAEKIPPFLCGEQFFNWCISIKPDQENDLFRDFKLKNNGNKKYFYPVRDYIRYENMRNINIPRHLAIPHPIVYRNLCKGLSDSWNELKTFLSENTQNQNHKISRIHLRRLKIKNKECLFQMNYKNFRKDSDPEPKLAIGARFLVEADISACFPSIYSHSIPWALIGKQEAKDDRDNSQYYNLLDMLIRNVKYGETHGILIGPHSSNLISEIILTSVDREMYLKGYRYVRNIDDYSCYVDSREKAEDFLRDLSVELKKYELELNHKKSKILELPFAMTEQWVRKLNTLCISKEWLSIKEISLYLDLAIDLVKQSGMNSAVLNYVIQILSKKKFGKNAVKYYLDRIHHLVLIYPYLCFVLEDNIFSPLIKRGISIQTLKIEEISNDLFQLGIKRKLWESSSYALYFAIKYNKNIHLVEDQNLFELAKQSNDCIMMLLSFLYEKKMNSNLDSYYELAIEKQQDNYESDRYWLFIYEVLRSEDLSYHTFKEMKRNNVSFIKSHFSLFVLPSPTETSLPI